MRKISKLIEITVLAFILCGNSPLAAPETVYPTGYQITSDYSLSADKIVIADTLVIRRVVVNGEAFGLTGLYFSDNFPPELEIVDNSVSVNGVATDHIILGPTGSQGPAGYDKYIWVIDLPGDTGTVNRTLQPGDSVVVTTMITCNDLGRFALPLHTAVFYGNGTGFFSTSDSLEVEFVLSLDVDDDIDPRRTLPSNSLSSLAYPNPFNASVIVRYAGERLKGRGILLEVYDLTGRKIHENALVSGAHEGYIVWKPPESISSGLYLYKLSAGKRSSKGKVTLIKYQVNYGAR